MKDKSPSDHVIALKQRFAKHVNYVKKLGNGERLILSDERFNRLVVPDTLLDNAVIYRCVFANSNFSGSQFRGVEMVETEFNRCIMTNCDFRGAVMRGIRIVKSDISKAGFQNVRTQKAISTEVSPALSNVDFSNSDFTGADLSGASMSGAILRGANLTAVNLAGANLSQVDLSGACIRDTDFSDVNIEGVKLEGAMFSLDDSNRTAFGDHPDFQKFEADSESLHQTIEDHEAWVNAEGRAGIKASFHDRPVMNVDLSDRNLAGVDFSKARIVGCRFDRAILVSANFSGAEISFTSFDGADARALNFSGAEISTSSFRSANFEGLKVAGYSARLMPNFENALFQQCEFTHASLPPSALERAKFTSCKMPKAGN